MMLAFWGVAAVLILGVLLALLRPLLWPDARLLDAAMAARRDIFRQQLEELRQDLAHGLLAPAQYQTAEAELQRRMLAELGDEGAPLPWLAPDRRTAAILLLLLPLAAVSIYLWLGTPQAITPSLQASPHAPMAEHMSSAGGLEPLLDTLRKKLELAPDNGDGWALLARSYVELGRHGEAADAFERAVTLLPGDAQLLADYADALAMVHGRELSGKPEALVAQALQLEPNNVKALMLAATAAFNRQQYAQAIGHWRQLQQALPAADPMQTEVVSWLDEARALQGDAASKPSTGKTLERKPMEDKSMEPESIASKPDASSASAAESAPVSVSGTVRLAPGLKLPAGATLYVYARAAQGPPMPLAIVRVANPELPFDYRITADTAPMPGQRLTADAEVVVVARLSTSGEAKPQAGDLQGMSQPLKADGRQVDIEIDRQLR